MTGPVVNEHYRGASPEREGGGAFRFQSEELRKGSRSVLISNSTSVKKGCFLRCGSIVIPPLQAY